MSAAGKMDLIVLVADKDMEQTVIGLLKKRLPALGIRALTFQILVHHEHDPGCLLRAHEMLRPYASRCRHALVMFDREGSGKEHDKSNKKGKTRAELEQEVEKRLSQAGWEDRAAAVVIDPELEIWVWSQSQHVEQQLGWHQGGLRDWLVQQELLGANELKPSDPKRAFLQALQKARKPRSPAIFSKLASAVSFETCTDEAFRKLRQTLIRWFGQAA